jgi:hypothetical protein
MQHGVLKQAQAASTPALAADQPPADVNSLMGSMDCGTSAPARVLTQLPGLPPATLGMSAGQRWGTWLQACIRQRACVKGRLASLTGRPHLSRADHRLRAAAHARRAMHKGILTA